MYFFPIVKRGIFSQQPQIVDEEILLKQVAEAIKYSTDSIPTPQKNPNKTKKDSVVTVLVRSKCQLSMIALIEKLHTQMVQKKGWFGLPAAWSQTPHRNWHVDLGNLSWKLGQEWILRPLDEIGRAPTEPSSKNFTWWVHLVDRWCYCLGRSSWGVSVKRDLLHHWRSGSDNTQELHQWNPTFPSKREVDVEKDKTHKNGTKNTTPQLQKTPPPKKYGKLWIYHDLPPLFPPPGCWLITHQDDIRFFSSWGIPTKTASWGPGGAPKNPPGN